MGQIFSRFRVFKEKLLGIQDLKDNNAINKSAESIRETNKNKQIQQNLDSETQQPNFFRTDANESEKHISNITKEIGEQQTAIDSLTKSKTALSSPLKQQDLLLISDKYNIQTINESKNKQIREVEQSTPEYNKETVSEDQTLDDNNHKFNSTEKTAQEIKSRKTENSDIQDLVPSTLTEIEEQMNYFETASNSTSFTKEELDALDVRLIEATSALNQVKNDQVNEKINKLRENIQLYGARIQTMREERSQLDKQVKTIEAVEAKIKEIDPEVRVFVGLESSKKFFELDETLIRSTLKLDDIRPEKGSDLHNNKIKLLKEIHKYTDILDERVKQTGEIEAMERQVKDMSEKIKSFNGTIGNEEGNSLNEQISQLKVSLEKLVTNEELGERKENCIKEVENYIKEIKLQKVSDLIV